MCEEERFCNELGRDERQLMIFELNGATEQVDFDPKNPEQQGVYQSLTARGLLALKRIGTRRGLRIPLVGEMVIPVKGQIHAIISMEGLMKLQEYCTQSGLVNSDGEV